MEKEEVVLLLSMREARLLSVLLQTDEDDAKRTGRRLGTVYIGVIRKVVKQVEQQWRKGKE